MGVWACMCADYQANFKRKASWLGVLTGGFRKAGYRAAFLYRLARAARMRKVPAVGPILDRWIKRSCQIDLCSLAEVGPGLYIPHAIGIVVGSGCRIGKDCHLLQCVTLGGSGKVRGDGQTQPIVGDGVLLGAGAKLVGPVIVGDRVIIGANAVVTRDVPADSVAVGAPARTIIRQGARVALLEQEGEIVDLLKGMRSQLEDLERRLARLEQGGDKA